MSPLCEWLHAGVLRRQRGELWVEEAQAAAAAEVWEVLVSPQAEAQSVEPLEPMYVPDFL